MEDHIFYYGSKKSLLSRKNGNNCEKRGMKTYSLLSSAKFNKIPMVLPLSAFTAVRAAKPDNETMELEERLLTRIIRNKDGSDLQTKALTPYSP